jgi:aminocarboxymuconate-semialdehyde decarboxylase
MKKRKTISAKAAKRPARGAARTSAKRKSPARAKGPAKKPFVIDFHAHIVVPEVLEFCYQHSLFAQAVAGKTEGGKAEAIPEPWMRAMTDMSARFKDMDAMGVDMQVISPSILQQCTYFAEPQEALKMERFGNDRISEAVARHPDRLVGLGSVPMQDTALACQELERCMRDLKLKGIVISSHVNEIELGDPRFEPFWAKAEQLGAVIFIHPAGSPDKRLRKNRLLITLGQPLEEAFAQSSLVYEGVMDRHPKIKIVMAHGGGFLPFYTGRHDNDYRLGRSGQTLKGDFSSYLPRFYYDTVLFNPDMLEFLVTKVPTNRLMLASDYPFAERRPVEFVRRAKKIAPKDQDAILGANCAKLLGISI